MDNSKIIEKIQKLLARANDDASSESERDTAMRMAYSLMAEHNMTMESMNEESNPRGRSFKETHGMTWAREIGMSVARLFFCKYYYANVIKRTKNGDWAKKINWAEHNFIGRESNSITAAELSNYLINSAFREGSRRMKTEDPVTPYAWRMDFCKGVASMIGRRASELRKAKEAENVHTKTSTGTDLVLADVYKVEFEANAEWAKNNVGKLVPSRGSSGVGDVNAFGAGLEYGKNLPLVEGITDNSKKNLRIAK